MTTMTEYKANNDLLGAYERYQTAGNTWKSRWWAVVEEIYYSCEDWAKQYVIDPIKRTLKKIRNSYKGLLENVMTYECEAEGCGAYIVQHFDANGELLWTKCGKADDAKRRFLQHFTSDYNGVAASGTCIAWYPCKNSNHALTVENIVRDHFEKRGYDLLGNDRFASLTKMSKWDKLTIKAKASVAGLLF